MSYIPSERLAVQLLVLGALISITRAQPCAQQPLPETLNCVGQLHVCSWGMVLIFVLPVTSWLGEVATHTMEMAMHLLSDP